MLTDGDREEEPASGEEQSTDQPDEQGASSEQETQDSDQDSEEGGDEAQVSAQFFDPNKIPDELKPAWKRMQGSYTRKMQSLSMSRRKAEAFDQLVSDPRVQALINGQPAGPQPRKNDSDSSDGSDTDSIRGMVREEIQSAMAPLRQSNSQNQVKAEFDAFKGKYPMWENYKAEMAAEMETNPALTFEQAFKNVAFEDAVNLGRAGGVAGLSSKKRANISKPSSVGGSKQTSGKKINSIQDAFDLAKTQLSGKGNRG